MNENLTEIACIIDRSGSMGHQMTDAIGGFNKFVENQKKEPGEANLTLVTFDTAYDVVHDGLNLKEVPELTEKTCFARGATALLDAVGKTINTVGSRLKNMRGQDRPGKVIVVITTDGEENSSREFSTKQIQDMIAHQKDVYNWEFVYMGVSEEDFSARNIDLMGVHNFAPDRMSRSLGSSGLAGAYTNLCSTVSSYRGGGEATMIEDDKDD